MPVIKGSFRWLRVILLVLNVLVALIMVGVLLAAFTPPALFTSISILALIYPIILFINLFFVIMWLLLKSKWFLLSLLVILIGFANLQNNFRFSLGSSIREDSTKLKILTHNVELFGLIEKKEDIETKREQILQFIKSENPQVICLQEYFSEGITPYAPLEGMKSDLNLNTHYFESYFSPRYNQLNGLVIFSKFPASGKGKLKFEGSRTFGIYTDLLIAGDTVRVYNIHLASMQLLPEDIDFVINAGQEKTSGIKDHAFKIYSKLSDALLLRERQMIYLLHQLSGCKYPVILSGDFNDTPSSYIYRQITNELKDTFREKGSGMSITFAGDIPFLRIDYIMSCDHFETSAYSRHKESYSDHYPLSAVLTKSN